MSLKFARFCDLLESLERVETAHRTLPVLNKGSREHSVISTWFKTNRKAVDDRNNDRVALLSCLFPERRTDRVYNIQAPTLLHILSRCLGLGRSRLNQLRAWKTSSDDDLGTWVCRIVSVTDLPGGGGSFSVEDVDKALEQVAAQCRFSGPAVRARKTSGHDRAAHEILDPIVRQMQSRELKWFIRLMLKNLNPVVLEEVFVLTQVHFFLPRLLKFQSTFEAAVRLLDSPMLRGLTGTADHHGNTRLTTPVRAEVLKPSTGVKVGRPTWIKARSIKHCLKVVANGRWTLEPKYDGEYCQVHIDLSKPDCIQLFAKSGKDASQDRIGVHGWIRENLKIGKQGCNFKKRCILEGELVVIDTRMEESRAAILPFHKIRKHVTRSGSFLGTALDSQAHDFEQLILIFYDVLLVDDEVTMALPYSRRRRRLSELLHPSDGALNRSQWAVINFGKLGPEKAVKLLQKQLAKAAVLRVEGLILKPDASYFALDDSSSNAGKAVKLKLDYIHGLGDTMDFAVIAATRDLKTAGSSAAKWTHFIIACVENKADVVRFGARPRYRVMESLTRPCISIPDMRYLTQHGSFVEEQYATGSTPSTFDFARRPDLRIDVVFRKPFIVEVLGSSFGKPSSKDYLMLRHPRIIKVHSDRGLEDVVSFAQLQQLAVEATGPSTDVDAEEEAWFQKLRAQARGKRPKYICDTSSGSGTTIVSQSTILSTPSRPPRGKSATIVRMDSNERFQASAEEPSLEHGPATPHIAPTHLVVPIRTSPTLTETRQDCVATTESTSHSRSPLSEIENDSSRVALHEAPSSSKRTRAEEMRSFSRSNHVKRPRQATASSPAHVGSIIAPRADHQGSGAISHDKPPLPIPSSSLPEHRAIFSSQPQQPKATSPPSSVSYHTASARSRCASPIGRPSIGQVRANPAEYHPRLQDLHAFKYCSNLRAAAIYLSPCVRSHLYLVNTLLPSLSPGHVTAYLSHWKRDLLHVDIPQAREANSLLPPVVGESQALAGLRKIVLVERQREQETQRCVERVSQEVRLAYEEGEQILVLDWRFAEDLLRLEMDGLSYLGGERLGLVEKAFHASHVATVRWSGRNGCNVVDMFTGPR